MRTGLFGGTFDPPHSGHLIAAQDAYEALALDQVLFIPAAAPPHKRGQIVTAADVRLEMVRAAIGSDARFAVDDRELRRPGPSYTVDTLRELRAEGPDIRELFLLIGADQYAELGTWRGVPEIRTLCRIAVLDRAGESAVSGEDVRVPVTRIDISSSDVRARLAAGRSVRYLVPASVESIIRSRALYPDAAGATPAVRNDSVAAG